MWQKKHQKKICKKKLKTKTPPFTKGGVIVTTKHGGGDDHPFARATKKLNFFLARVEGRWLLTNEI